jgi:hypothetical protein
MKTKSASPRARKSADPAKPRSTRKPVVIDTSDIPPLSDKFFERAVRNPYPPLGTATLRKIRKRVPQGRMKVREKLF